jgi:hypothetical protein
MMSLLLSGATLIDGLGAEPLPHGSVLVEGDRIARVGRAAPRVTRNSWTSAG